MPILSFMWLHVITQLLLILLWWLAGDIISARAAIYDYHPGLFGYLLLASLAICSLLWGWFRAYVLLAETGRKSRRAAATRGFPAQ